MKKYVQPIMYKGVEIMSHPDTDDNSTIIYSLFDKNRGGNIGIHENLGDAKIHIDMRNHERESKLEFLAILLLVILIIIF